MKGNLSLNIIMELFLVISLFFAVFRNRSKTQVDVRAYMKENFRKRRSSAPLPRSQPPLTLSKPSEFLNADIVK